MQCARHIARRLRHFSTSVPDVILRPYQEQCLLACTEALESGASRIGVSLPTGSGKTTVFISLLSRIGVPPSNPQASKALIVVNSIELARQSAEQVARLFPDWTVEIEQGTKHKASGSADVFVPPAFSESMPVVDPFFMKHCCDLSNSATS